MNSTAWWDLHLTARSSITHGGETRGTIAMLRRETIVQPDGIALQVPIISGNSLRGRLRRISEELLRDHLGYEGLLSPAAAHALRGGGSLVKSSGEPLSGSRLQRVRELLPHIAIFGAAGGGAIIDGALSVGKAVPHLQETAHITGTASDVSAFTAVQLEAYARVDDTTAHDFAPVLPEAAGAPNPGSRQMLFQVETLPSGTRFSSWIQLRRPSDLELSLMADILAVYASHGTLGGRTGIGHGLVDVELNRRPGPGSDSTPDPTMWRDHAITHRDEILAAAQTLT